MRIRDRQTAETRGRREPVQASELKSLRSVANYSHRRQNLIQLTTRWTYNQATQSSHGVIGFINPLCSVLRALFKSVRALNTKHRGGESLGGIFRIVNKELSRVQWVFAIFSNKERKNHLRHSVRNCSHGRRAKLTATMTFWCLDIRLTHCLNL